ncbi:MAG TPA: hypothetical protein VFS79_04915 [Arthrobacter sp.]|nr:hypothetical protein [Arthrobacter sp.]
MNDPLIEALHEHEPLSDPLEEVHLRLAIAASDIAQLRAEIVRLEQSLDDSRRLNERAAELLDQVYARLAQGWGTAGRIGASDHAGAA